jgi:hypothetical protein
VTTAHSIPQAIEMLGALVLVLWWLLLVGLPLVIVAALGLTLPLWVDVDKGLHRSGSARPTTSAASWSTRTESDQLDEAASRSQSQATGG